MEPFAAATFFEVDDAQFDLPANAEIDLEYAGADDIKDSVSFLDKISTKLTSILTADCWQALMYLTSYRHCTMRRRWPAVQSVTM